MASAYVIEVLNRTAGLAVRDHRGFRFHASDSLFRRMDGRRFRDLKTIHSAVADIIELARTGGDRRGRLAHFIGRPRPEPAARSATRLDPPDGVPVKVAAGGGW